jgi:hypothetical protein
MTAADPEGDMETVMGENEKEATLAKAIAMKKRVRKIDRF